MEGPVFMVHRQEEDWDLDGGTSIHGTPAPGGLGSRLRDRYSWYTGSRRGLSNSERGTV